jgi:hypothetical protein
MPADLNIGRFLVVVGLAAPSVVAIFERHPVKLPRDPDPREIRARDRWALHLTCHSLQEIPIDDVIERVKLRVAQGVLERDSTVAVDATLSGALAIRRARVLGGLVIRVSDIMLADQGVDVASARMIALKDVADAARHAGERLRYSALIPRTVRAKLTADAREGTFSPQTRVLAIGLWHAQRYGASEFVSRRPSPELASKQWIRECVERDEDAREEKRREDRELQALFGDGTS